MSAVNGHAGSETSNRANGAANSVPSGTSSSPTPAQQFAPAHILDLVAALEVPFDQEVIEWRVINTAKNSRPPRGQVIPYADQRAYTDRLNALFMPAGWTRRYVVHTSGNFERGQDKKTVAKVFVTCELTIFGLGSHSATGEEWTDDPNAGTSAEAQAFKRAAACFGLGRYLYYFTGIWVDLDEKNRPKKKPRLFGWATPEGWRSGLRPGSQASGTGTDSPTLTGDTDSRSSDAVHSSDSPLLQEIEHMQDRIGTAMYRGLLRKAKAWKPSQITNVSEQKKTLERMQAAERGLQRLKAAMDKVDQNTLAAVVNSLKARSIDRISDLETLHALVVKLEAAGSSRT